MIMLQTFSSEFLCKKIYICTLMLLSMTSYEIQTMSIRWRKATKARLCIDQNRWEALKAELRISEGIIVFDTTFLKVFYQTVQETDCLGKSDFLYRVADLTLSLTLE